MSLAIEQVVLLIIGIVVLVVLIFLFLFHGVGPFKGISGEICDPIRLRYCCNQSSFNTCIKAFNCTVPEGFDPETDCKKPD